LKFQDPILYPYHSVPETTLLWDNIGAPPEEPSIPPSKSASLSIPAFDDVGFGSSLSEPTHSFENVGLGNLNHKNAFQNATQLNQEYNFPMSSTPSLLSPTNTLWTPLEAFEDIPWYPDLFEHNTLFQNLDKSFAKDKLSSTCKPKQGGDIPAIACRHPSCDKAFRTESDRK